MYKNFYKLFIITALFISFSSALALTKPGPEADIDNLSYVFYLYYDHGQLFADRDYEIKFDVVNEKFVAETAAPSVAYRADILNFKSETVKTFNFDPQKGNTSFTSGKVQIKGPYVPDGSRVTFYNNKGNPILNISVSGGSVCNDDGACTATEGENQKNCVADCKQAGPSRTVVPAPVFDEGPDLTMILIYVFGGLAAVVGAWFGWKELKKRREGNFLPPPPASGPPSTPGTPFPPVPPPSL